MFWLYGHFWWPEFFHRWSVWLLKLRRVTLELLRPSFLHWEFLDVNHFQQITHNYNRLGFWLFLGYMKLSIRRWFRSTWGEWLSIRIQIIKIWTPNIFIIISTLNYIMRIICEIANYFIFGPMCVKSDADWIVEPTVRQLIISQLHALLYRCDDAPFIIEEALVSRGELDQHQLQSLDDLGFKGAIRHT